MQNKLKFLQSKLRRTAIALASVITYGVAHAQTVAPGTPTFEIESLRDLPQHHPERGELTPEEVEGVEALHKNVPLDRHLSIFVSDEETMDQIKFSEVMDQLVRQSHDPLLTKEILFHQWWDTAGEGAGLGLGPHCDDNGAPETTHNMSQFNHFPYRCPRKEATEALSDPFTNEIKSNIKAYSAIAYSNRFDLVSPSNNDCGEYRIVFARNSGRVPPPPPPANGNLLNRNLIIFEARVPNPAPHQGIKGCRPILDFWHSLSEKSMTAVDRGKKLHDFYLKGLPEHHVDPIVSIAHYTFGSGQIRTNQFMDAPNSSPTFDWTLREFKTFRTNGTLVIIPDSVKSNPGNNLFLATSTDVRIGALNQTLRAQMKKILGDGKLSDVNTIAFSTSGHGINSFESDEKENEFGDILAAYAPGNVENTQLKKNIQDSLTLLGSSVTPLNVIKRVRTQTCAGCHKYSNGDTDLGGGAKWPDKDTPTHTMLFTQESEVEADQVAAVSGTGKRYAISKAVECFLDAREVFMRKALSLPKTSEDHCPH
jgi:hypothetical protein